MNRRRFCAVIGAAALLTKRVLGAPEPLRIEMKSQCFGATSQIVVPGVTKPHAEKALKRAFDELAHIEKIMSIYQPDSQLSQLNRTGCLANPDPLLVRVFSASVHFVFAAASSVA